MGRAYFFCGFFMQKNVILLINLQKKCNFMAKNDGEITDFFTAKKDALKNGGKFMKNPAKPR